MKLIIGILLMLLAGISEQVSAQAVTNTGVDRDMYRAKSLRLDYGNDYFTATDFYLSQTIYFELIHDGLKRSPVYKLFYKPAQWETRYGAALEHNAYTPVFYERKEIQYGDRPFAGAFFLKTFTISTDTEKHQRIVSALSTGITGNSAGGKWMQTFIHENTNNVIPRGWDNQIKNDVLLNYEIAYQKQLFSVGNVLLATADATARLGTLSTKANIGFTVMAGYFHSPFASLNIKGRKIQFYAYDHPEINAIGYDATLQGGLLNRTSPYVIASGDVNRVVFRNNWGLVAHIGRVYLEYYQSFMTKEFKTGMDFHNGGIQIGLAL